VNDRESHDLERTLGFWTAVTIIVGTTIGSGIFLVSTDMAKAVGTPSMVFFVWVFGGVLTLFGALSYAEMASAMPTSGGEYVYLTEAYGPVAGFLYGWAQSWVGKPASIAALGTAFITYLTAFFPQLDRVFLTTNWPIGPGGSPFEIRDGQIAAMGSILVLVGINYVGARWGGAVQVAGTALKTLLIATVVLAAFFGGAGDVTNFRTSTDAIPGGVAGFFAALTAALFAYDGWTNAPMIGAEISHPERNLPRALILGTLTVFAVYFLTNLGYFYVLSAREVAASPRVATDAMQKVFGSRGAELVSAAALISIFSSLNGVILSGARVPFAMARNGHFFGWANRIHPRFGTPGASLIAMGIWACVVLLSGRFQELARLVVFNSWLSYALATAGLIVLRNTRPDLPRPYRVLGYPLVPVIFVAVALALLGSTLATYPRESGLGIILILAGLPFYFHWKR
jgi:APA family basic amino acid/polyamine antiporter